MKHWMECKWHQFGLWLFKDIMPLEDPFLRFRVVLREVMPRYNEALKSTTAIFRHYAEVMAGAELEGIDREL